jgi:Fuc2NAc and GlcNAc transferase
MYWFSYLIIPIVVCSGLGVFLYKKIAIQKEIISNLNYRTLHEVPTPRGGGIVFSLLFSFTIFVLWYGDEISDQIFYMFGLGGLVATLFGFIDDVKNIRAKIKLAIQLFLGGWAIYWLEYGDLPLLESIPFLIVTLVALFFMVWMMNAYNFMDGIDGMAASGAIFISLTLATVLFLTEGPVEITTIFILIAATVSGFMFFNWPPATIFMGDAGSVFLGYIFGSLLLFTVLNNDISIWSWITVFGYFFADTTVTQIMRVILVKKWYLAHRSHAYQNLARITGSHLKVTGTVVLYNIIWIFPLVVWSVLQPEMEVVAAILAVAPAMIVTYKYGPLLSSS